jgi:prepilin-type N-terminal cleavage/methylation domain-containing protein
MPIWKQPLRIAPSRSRRRAAGFTLTELMVVVVITGVLASLGFAALSKHVSSAWGAEALNMVQSIRGAQERWRAEHMMYLDVSSSDTNWYPTDPTQPLNREQLNPFFYDPTSGVHADNTRWLLLRPTVTGPVRFGYMVNAGSAGEAMTAPAAGPAVTWPTPRDNWYVIQALGDTDWGGTTSYYRASSLDGEIYTTRHGE